MLFRSLHITPASPWENGYNVSLGYARLRLNGSLRDELRGDEVFYSLAEARVLIEAWRRHCNTVRPHGSLIYQPAPRETASPPLPPSGSAPPPGGNGQRGNNALTINTDY